MTWLLLAGLLVAQAPTASTVAQASTPRVGGADPREALVELQLAGETASVLAEAERLLALNPEVARGAGMDYLRGRLLESLGRSEEASQAYLAAITSAPALAGFSYYRLALGYERLGHPEMAAGLVARIVGEDPSFPRLGEAARLLDRALAKGGDCRLLNGLREESLSKTTRRRVRMMRADCAVNDGRLPDARRLLVALMEEARGDEPALEAARLLTGGRFDPLTAAQLQLAGLTFHNHRVFERSSELLDLAFSVDGDPVLLTNPQFDARYARARNDFWQGQFAAAALGYGQLSDHTRDPRRKAKAYFHRGRSLELLGNWTAAAESFRRSFAADRNGRWADAALLSVLRLEWRQGREARALEYYQALVAERRWSRTAARAALFLAASDLAQGRGDRAADWLADAKRSGAASAQELDYWRARQLELVGQGLAAVRVYADVMERDPYHPLAQFAARRLREEPALPLLAEQEGKRLAASGRVPDLYRAWLLLGSDHSRGRSALGSAALRLRQDPRAEPFLRLSSVSVRDWPLWRASLNDPADLLLGLGLWSEGAPAVSRHFPINQPSLAFTGGQLLAGAGQVRQSLYIAEILQKRIPSTLPAALLPQPYRQLLYPFAHRQALLEAGNRHGVDPFLISAVIREESRFDARALSAVSARGLMQITHLTAQRYAANAGLAVVEPEDLYRPSVAISLGAAYLADLFRLFEGLDPAAVAAYNAGEDQARLWLEHCFTRDPAEYFTKVSFTETRGYVRKVLTSRAHYRELYGGRL